MTASIVIKRGREKPIVQQHPWIFSGAIETVKDNPALGDIVTVTDHAGRFLARGYWNPRSQIQVRLLTWQDEPINEDWWRQMLFRAIEARQQNGYDDQTSCRIVNAENDFLPGLIVDKYYDAETGGWLVVQALTLGIDTRKEMLASLLTERPDMHTGLSGIYERSDVDVRRKEGLPLTTGVLYGNQPPDHIVVDENVLVRVNILRGHKTGYYLDQTPNRRLLSETITALNRIGGVTSIDVLNLFSYTGGFGLHALEGGATRVINVDSSHEVLELAEENVRLNDAGQERDATHPSWLERGEFIQADVFELLRDYAGESKQFDVVILDPPKFAHNAQQVEKAARGYKDINLNAFRCVKQGGYLMTFSCSGAISADLFQKIVFGALADSGRQAQILSYLGPGPDHPVALTFPEGAYLKGLLLRVY